jgi:hypothetical protein
MAFGRLGSLGTGFGRLGEAGSGVIPPGGAGLLVGEQNGVGVDFTYPLDAERVAVKTAGVVVKSGLDTFFQNSSTTPKLVYDVTGTLVWTPNNLFLNSAAPATQSVVTVVGQAYTVTVTGSGSMTGSAGAAGVATAGSPLTFVATTTTSTFTLAGSLTQIQMNFGRVATAYLPTTAAKRYGLAIDYDPATLISRGLLMEGGIQNLCLWTSDLTNAAWVKSSMNTALTATGPQGFANTATTLTATGANATALQSITNASTAKVTSVFLKRRTGTGNVDVTQDGGTTWATQAITSSWARYAIAEATVLNPVVGIRLVTSGNEVDVALWQCEITTNSKAATSPYPNYSLAQSRAGDNYTFLLSTIPALASEYSMYVRFVIPNPATNANAPVALTDGTANEQAKFTIAASALRLSVIDGGSGLANIGGNTVVANTPMSGAGRFKLNDCAFSTDGAAAVVDTAVTLPTVTETRFGGAGANAAAANTWRLTKLAIITDRGWSDGTLAAKSAA